MKPGRLVRAAGGLSVARAGALLLQAAHFALAARLLPRPEFAGLAAALALVTIALALAEFGLTHTTVLHLTADRDHEGRAMGAAVLANWLLLPVALGLTAPVALLALSGAGQFAFVTLLPWLILSTLQLPFAAYWRHRLRFGRLAVGELVGRGLPMLALAPVLVIGRGWSAHAQLVAVGASLAAGALVGLGILCVPPLLRPARGSAGSARRLLADAAPLGVTSGLSMIHVRVDQLVLSAYGVRLGLAAYALAYRVLDAALVLVGGAGAAAFPMLAHAQGDERAALARAQAALLGAGALLMGVGAFALAPQLMALLGGGRYPEAAWLARLLCPALVASTVNACAVQVAVVEGRARKLMKVAAIGVTCNLALNLALDRAYGARAAALATVATELLGLVLVARISRSLRGWDPLAIAAKTLGAFGAATFGALVLWREVSPVAGGALTAGATAAGLLALWRAARPGAGSAALVGAAAADAAPGATAVSGPPHTDAPVKPKVKVVQVITKLTLGGAQETVLRYCLLDPDRFETVLVAGPDGDGPTDLRSRADELGIRVVTLPRLHRPVRPLADLLAIVDLARLFRREGAAVVHTHSSKAGLVGRIAARLAGVPIVLHTVHGWSFHEGMARPVKAATVLGERLAARWTTRLVVVGESDRREGLRAGIGRPEQYVLIRSAIELDDASPATTATTAMAATTRAALGIPPGVPVVGSVTRLYAQKDPATFVEVAARTVQDVPGTRIVLVGDGPLRADVERRIAELGLGPNMLLLGWRNDVRTLTASFDVFLSTARWEGLPRTVVEAAAAAVPVVATDVGSTSEIVVDGVTGYLAAPGDVAGLAARTVQLLRDPDLRHRLGQAAAAQVQSFGVEEMLRLLDETYARLLQEVTHVDTRGPSLAGQH